MLINSYHNSLQKKLKNKIKQFFPIIGDIVISRVVRQINEQTLQAQREFFKHKLLFTHVEMELINRCNNDCPFCPVNKHQDIRVLNRMDEQIFYKIIDNLKELNYSSIISYFSNNEPLLDDRTYEFIAYGKRNLPNARHILYTNGLMLTIKKYNKLFEAGLDFLKIDNYNDDFKLIKSVQIVYDYFKDKINPYSNKTEIVLRKKNEVLSNRGGYSPNAKQVEEVLDISCYLPFYQFIIRPDGKVSMCCVDAYGTTTMGDIAATKIEDIWYGDVHMNLLKELFENNRKNINLCKKCDTVAFINRQRIGVQQKHVKWCQ